MEETVRRQVWRIAGMRTRQNQTGTGDSFHASVSSFQKVPKKRYATRRRVLLVTLRHVVQWRHKEVKRYVKIYHR